MSQLLRNMRAAGCLCSPGVMLRHAARACATNRRSRPMGGTGEHLLFAYWSTANYMNTNVNVHSPLGVRTSGETKNVVRVVVGTHG